MSIQTLFIRKASSNFVRCFIFINTNSNAPPSDQLRKNATTPAMPPHLHPRSRMTSSLFASTLVASFFVVALPHVLPCPVPRTKYADGEIMVDEQGRRKRWRKTEATRTDQGMVQFDQPAGEVR
ncbi:hypothetical protein L249_4178 [Ophiocordyceps polyrhachis-furcata BCC 54312]|uniref:Uncharacterized protein n=1 Tax=Ophiocordyceps polyrhachis-furcata BCC 54312 TaxID=1330021 RepID=A0A367L5V9_9HYPO|nr:hypothetical protein L249_4178 [Ophiocordyceps polyrhachis-furcata BCC 54312]